MRNHDFIIIMYLIFGFVENLNFMIEVCHQSKIFFIFGEFMNNDKGEIVLEA
jgi:hypothetical protein